MSEGTQKMSGGQVEDEWKDPEHERINPEDQWNSKDEWRNPEDEWNSGGGGSTHSCNVFTYFFH